MYTLEPTGISLWYSTTISRFVPFDEIKQIKKINLFQSIVMNWNPFGPAFMDEYMGLSGDPLHLILIETATVNFVLRNEDVDKFIVEANNRLSAYRKIG